MNSPDASRVAEAQFLSTSPASDSATLARLAPRHHELFTREANSRESFMAEQIKWPEKTRELHSHHFDSTWKPR